MPHENGHDDADRLFAGVGHAGPDGLPGAVVRRLGFAGASVVLRPGDTPVVWRSDRLGRPPVHPAFLTTGLAAEGTGVRSSTVFRKGG